MFNKAKGRLAIDVLADAIAAIASLPRSDDGVCALWTMVADEQRCPPDRGEYTTLRIFGVVPVATQPNAVAVQAITYGVDDVAAMERAEAIHDAMLDPQTNFSPRLGWAVTDADGGGWLLDVFELSEPFPIGTDDRERSRVVSNFNLAYRRVA